MDGIKYESERGNMSKERKTMLSLRNINKSFGSLRVLKDVSTEIKEGELVTFVGPSGCGKTTLLRCIGGLTKPDSGDVILDGMLINDVTPDKRGTQMFFQNYALFPHMTVAGNVGYGLEVHKWKKEKIKERVAEMLHIVQLDGLGDRHIDKLSGGQQQRVALARAMAVEPRLLLLDEPLSNLDANLRVQMRATLREIQRRVKITTIFVTHDQFEAMSISDRVIVMNSGMVEQIGLPREIYEKPKNKFIANFVGHINLFEAVVSRIERGGETVTVFTDMGDLEILGSGYDIGVDHKVLLVVRPEAIRLKPVENVTGVNEIEGIVKSSMYAGSTIRYTINLKTREVIVDSYDPANIGTYTIGEKVLVVFPKKNHMIIV